MEKTQNISTLTRLGVSVPRATAAPEADGHSLEEEEDYSDMPLLMTARTHELTILADEDIIVPPSAVRTVQVRSARNIRGAEDDQVWWFEPTSDKGICTPEGPSYETCTQILVTKTHQMRHCSYVERRP